MGQKPRQNGSVELNPETKAIMSSYSAEIKQARQVDDVVFFEISLTLIDMQQNKREWTVLRRYSQFDALRSQLQKDLGIKAHNFPSEAYFRESSNEGIILERQVELAAFVSTVVLKHLNHQHSADFIELELHKDTMPARPGPGPNAEDRKTTLPSPAGRLDCQDELTDKLEVHAQRANMPPRIPGKSSNPADLESLGQYGASAESEEQMVNQLKLTEAEEQCKVMAAQIEALQQELAQAQMSQPAAPTAPTTVPELPVAAAVVLGAVNLMCALHNLK